MTPVFCGFTGRGRGRRMEQSEYFDGGPDEYHPPPGRGKLRLTYHLSLVSACARVSDGSHSRWLHRTWQGKGVRAERIL